MSNKKKKLILVGVILVVAGLIALGAVLFWSPKEKGKKRAKRRARADTVTQKVAIDQRAFNRAAQKFLKRIEGFRKKAASFDEAEALEKLGPNRLNGFYYRFDDHLQEASLSDQSGHSLAEDVSRPLLAFEFNGEDAPELRSRKDHFTSTGTAVRFPSRDQSARYPLESEGSVAIDPRNVGEIEVSVSATRAAKLYFGWCREDKPFQQAAKIRKGYGYISIEIGPTEGFQTYRILASSALKNREHLKPGDKIRKIYFWAIQPNEKGSEVEVDYLRFYSKKRKYARAFFGADYETLNLEMRKVLYTNTPSEISYSVSLPETQPVSLYLGMGVLQPEDPVEFSVTVEHRGKAEQLLARAISDNDRWYDETLDLSPWRGKEIEVRFSAESANGNIAFWSNPIAIQSPQSRFNAILLLEDALRADHLSGYGYARRQTTPVKDALFADGVRFANAFSQSTKTRSSCPSFMTSLYPTATGVWRNDEYLHSGFLTLAEALRSQGFATGSFVQNTNAGPANGLHQGFSHLHDYLAIGTRAEKAYSDRLFRFLERVQNRNFFIYIHLLDPHGVYDPPPPYDAYYKSEESTDFVKRQRLLDPEWVEKPTANGRINLYDGEIRYNDEQLTAFLDKLKELGMLEDTLLIFVSDHGEHLGEHRLWGHHPPGYIQGINVPMMMYYPKKLPKDTTVAQPVQLLDLMPTILELAGVNPKALLLQGDSLVSLIKGRRMGFWDNRMVVSEEVMRRKKKSPRAARGSIFHGKWHVLTSKLKSKGRSSRRTDTIVFDYIGDRAENNPARLGQSDELLKTVKRLVKKYQAMNLEAYKHFEDRTSQGLTLDPKQQEQLKALGYME